MITTKIKRVATSVMAAAIVFGTAATSVGASAAGYFYTRESCCPNTLNMIVPKTMVSYKVETKSGKKVYTPVFNTSHLDYGGCLDMGSVNPAKYKSISGPKNNKFTINYGKLLKDSKEDAIGVFVLGKSEKMNVGVCQHNKGAETVTAYVNSKPIKLKRSNIVSQYGYSGKATVKVGGKDRKIIVYYGENPTSKVVKTTGTLTTNVLYNHSTGDIEFDKVYLNTSAGGTKRTFAVFETK